MPSEEIGQEARRRAARQTIAAYHEQQPGLLLGHLVDRGQGVVVAGSPGWRRHPGDR